MAHLQIHHSCILKGPHKEFSPNFRNKRETSLHQTVKIIGWKNTFRKQRREQKAIEEERIEVAESRDFDTISISTTTKDGIGFVLNEHGWHVRRMIESHEEMKMVARIQAEAFHQPVLFFNDLFLEFFQAEVLSGLVYRLKNSPPNRYACLVAMPSMDVSETREIQDLVGVVDITVLRDNETMQYLDGAEEYMYVSGIAVSRKFRQETKSGNCIVRSM